MLLTCGCVYINRFLIFVGLNLKRFHHLLVQLYSFLGWQEGRVLRTKKKKTGEGGGITNGTNTGVGFISY